MRKTVLCTSPDHPDSLWGTHTNVYWWGFLPHGLGGREVELSSRCHINSKNACRKVGMKVTSTLFLRNCTYNYKEIYIYHGYIIQKVEVIFAQSLLHYQHAFSTSTCEAIRRMHKTPCCSVKTALHAHGEWKPNTAELHLSVLIGMASHLDMQKIQLTGFSLKIGYIGSLMYGCHYLQ